MAKKRSTTNGTDDKILCSIKSCHRKGTRLLASLRATYEVKENHSGRVCEGHYRSDLRSYKRNHDDIDLSSERHKRRRTAKKPISPTASETETEEEEEEEYYAEETDDEDDTSGDSDEELYTNADEHSMTVEQQTMQHQNAISPHPNEQPHSQDNTQMINSKRKNSKTSTLIRSKRKNTKLSISTSTTTTTTSKRKTPSINNYNSMENNDSKIAKRSKLSPVTSPLSSVGTPVGVPGSRSRTGKRKETESTVEGQLQKEEQTNDHEENFNVLDISRSVAAKIAKFNLFCEIVLQNEM